MNYAPSPATQAAAMLNRAKWHRAEAINFLRHSCAAMRQHEREAEDLERRAAELLNTKEKTQ